MRLHRRSLVLIPVVCVSLLGAGALPALAASYDLKEITPAVQQAIDQRKARYGELQQLKQAGSIGENNAGLVEALTEASAPTQLAIDENRDRLVIYQAIVEQHSLGPDGLAQVQTAFAAVKRDRAKPGEMIQLPSGDWVKK